ncbi:Presenilin-like protein [Arabidopsis thaliana]|uniref:Presenilin-like protein At1g08700 n=4 Tax=Arabidopsis TaxID=3701 RepID=PSNA_ARATH|nr:Presenilin-1 [Arabidopsis thaliana]O64668.1 RecName: Full=Presenilin-like protein At1g08700 [Arabidopsis thaliana]KAG7645583.1 Peptidase A22A presenilin [Arabidopsis thaliana x Arabidopsis arenosa]AAF99776.1 F22O13.18 [Arabidopsis thaliana]AAL24266.1 At1g08700/F22O13_18 [Arabidopsis thaliana]ABH04603.1 At1g08700 [Arabidopsis thaliana]AEE28336.1 Presenilin-1 [Arabidopsis thaliana]|eukprot:NP_172346.1 Presenilin-1 [Arabidopsis thaliana]
MESSILDSLGVEIIGVMAPVSICMFLVVLLTYSLSVTSDPQIRSAANLIYIENPSDSTTVKLEGSLANAIVFVVLIAAVTFILVLLFYYNFTNFLKHYMRFSAFFVLGTMGGAIFLSIIQHFSIPVDSITCFILLFNFTILGTLSVFAGGIPIVLRQCYMVVMGIVVAAWFTKLPEWTTWFILVALALYDLVAVLAPGGPLKLLVELASSRDEELPAMVYEARPTVSSGNQRRNRGSSLRALVGGGGVSDSGSVELQAVRNHDVNQLGRENSHNMDYNAIAVRDIDNVDDGIGNGSRGGLERSPLVGSPSASEHSTSVGTRGNMEDRESVMDEEMSPLVELMGWGDNREEARGLEESDNVVDISNRGIKLGLGDFIFYSVLVGRAAMYDLMTVYACYLAIISGLGCTLILLSVYNRALPALPISIMLGVVFYFLTRLLMEPFVVGVTTNLMMF